MGFDETAVESSTPRPGRERERESVLSIVKEVIGDLREGGQESASGKDVSRVQRYRNVISKTAPRVNKSVKLMSADLVHWMNRGGPWRAFLILTAGIIASVGLSGVFIFLLFLITATVNAVIIALLGSVAAVGAVVAIFFTALTAIYIGVLAVAAIVISTIIFFTVITVLSVAGWVAFLWVVWLALKKLSQIFQGSIALTASTFQHTVNSVSSQNSFRAAE